MTAFTVDFDEDTYNWLESIKVSKKYSSKGQVVKQCVHRMRKIIDKELGNV